MLALLHVPREDINLTFKGRVESLRGGGGLAAGIRAHLESQNRSNIPCKGSSWMPVSQPSPLGCSGMGRCPAPCKLLSYVYTLTCNFSCLGCLYKSKLSALLVWRNPKNRKSISQIISCIILNHCVLIETIWFSVSATCVQACSSYLLS